MNINYEDVRAAVREWLEEPFVYNNQCGICSQISTKVSKTIDLPKIAPLVRIMPLVRMSSDLLISKFPPFSGDISYPISGCAKYFHHGNNKTLWQGEQRALRNQLIEVLKSADLSIEEDGEGYLFILFKPASE